MSELTAKTIFEDKIATQLAENPDKVTGINALYQFCITGDNGGNYYVDLTGEKPQVVSGTADKADCTITASDCDFIDLYTGNLNGQMAFMTGKLKIAGDMGLAMKFQKIIG